MNVDGVLFFWKLRVSCAKATRRRGIERSRALDLTPRVAIRWRIMWTGIHLQPSDLNPTAPDSSRLDSIPPDPTVQTMNTHSPLSSVPLLIYGCDASWRIAPNDLTPTAPCNINDPRPLCFLHQTRRETFPTAAALLTGDTRPDAWTPSFTS
jgi:hypothetical protein